ncbi:MAG: hypothetical protein E4H03_11655, partial [Myxococcales bacterium]
MPMTKLARLFLTLVIALTATSVSAQETCVAGPRVYLSDADFSPADPSTDIVCNVGEPCQITVVLEAGGTPVASTVGRLFSAPAGAFRDVLDVGEIGDVCPGGTCQLGSGGTAQGFCVNNPVLCKFTAVADGTPDPVTFALDPFVDKTDIASLSVICTKAGVYSLSLGDFSLGDTLGATVDGCAAGNQLTCIDPIACGDGNIDAGEQCDGANLGAAT